MLHPELRVSKMEKEMGKGVYFGEGYAEWVTVDMKSTVGEGRIWACTSDIGLSPADPQDTGKQVDLVSASVVVVGVIAALLFCLLVVVVVVMSRYHRRKAQQMTQK